MKFLKTKYRPKTRIIPDEIDGIIIKDQSIPENFSTEPRIYGGVSITETRKELSLPPKYAMYDQVDPVKCQAEIEKALTKLRWERISNQKPGETAHTNEGDQSIRINRSNDDPINNNSDASIRNNQKSTTDFRKKRATDFDFNRRVYLPPPLKPEDELQLQLLKMNLKRTTEDYKRTTTITNNLTEGEK